MVSIGHKKKSMNCHGTVMDDRVLKLEITVLDFYLTLTELDFHLISINSC